MKPGMFEIEEKGSFQAGNVEVAKHLGDVVIVEGIDHLGIDDDGVVDNEIGNESADEMLIVMDGVLLLLLADKSLLCELDDKGSLVDLFIQTGLELVEHIHGRTDNDFSELFVVSEYGIRIQQPSFILKHPCPSVPIRAIRG